MDARIDELKALGEGWLAGDGHPLDAEGLEWVRKILHVLVDQLAIPEPYIYPNPIGSIDVEWDMGQWTVGCDFDLVGRVIEMDALDVKTGEYKIRSCKDEGEIADFIRQLS